MKVGRSLLVFAVIVMLAAPAIAEEIKPIHEVLPGDAMYILLVRDVPQLLEHIRNFIPPIASFIPDAADLMVMMNLPPELAGSPLGAFLLFGFAPEYDFSGDEGFFVSLLPNAEDYLAGLGDPVDGIYDLGDRRPSAAYYQGYVVFSEREELERMLNTDVQPHLPKDSTPSFEDTDAFLRNRTVAFRRRIEYLEHLRETGNLGGFAEHQLHDFTTQPFLQFWLKLETLDMWFSFSDNHLSMDVVIELASLTPDLLHPKPAPGVDVNQPKILHLDNFSFFGSGKVFSGICRMMLTADRADEVQPEQYKALADLLETCAGQASTIAALTPQGLQAVSVWQLTQPAKADELIQAAVAILNSSSEYIDLTYQPAAGTLGNVQTGRLDLPVRFFFGHLGYSEQDDGTYVHDLDALDRAMRGMLKADTITADVAVVDNYLIIAIGEGLLERQIALLRGDNTIRAAQDNPAIKQALAEIGTDYQSILRKPEFVLQTPVST